MLTVILKRSTGFTLLEILIAMAIFTLIGLASTSLLTTVVDSDRLSTERFEKLESLQRAMLTLERDVLQSVPRATRINGEENLRVMNGGRDLFDSEADGLALVHAGWHNPQLILPRSTLQGVVYRLKEGQLQRLYGNYVDNVIGFEPKIKVLLEEVEDFRVAFIGSSNDATNALSDSELNWVDSYVGVALPKAVAITITSAEFGEIRREFLLGQGE